MTALIFLGVAAVATPLVLVMGLAYIDSVTTWGGSDD